ncbi:hypothetical protein TNCV_1006881 [Trichonephila clavipes]|nr:hypothetical protein TNCV_1006881 [Trichonephila clavipes]
MRTGTCDSEIQYHPKQGYRMHNATVQQPFTTVSPNSNPTNVVLQAEARFVCKYHVVSFHCLYQPFIALLAMPGYGYQSRVNESLDAFRIFHSAANGVEWYEWAQNDT